MEREQQDSAGALIVSPVNEEKMEKDISGSRLNIPVVLLNTRLETSSAACVAAPDYVEMGRRLAEQIAASHERRIPVCLVGEASRTIASVKFEEGIREVLEDLGQEVLLYEKSEEENYQALLGRVFQMKWRVLFLWLWTRRALQVWPEFLKTVSVFRHMQMACTEGEPVWQF